MITNMDATLGMEYQVNTYTVATQQESSVLALADRGYLITWDGGTSDTNPERCKHVQRFAADGSRTGSEYCLYRPLTAYDDHGYDDNMVTILSNGTLVVVYRRFFYDLPLEDKEDDSGIYGQLYSVDGSKIGSLFHINTYTWHNQFYPQVAAVEGGFVVTWSSYEHEGVSDSWGVFGQRYANSGAKIGSEFQVNTLVAGDQWNCCVTGLSNGGFVALWDNQGLSIRGQIYTAQGSRAGAELEIPEAAFGHGIKVTSLPDNTFVVTWLSGEELRGQKFTNAGTPFGNAFQVVFPGTDNFCSWGVSPLAGGGFVVVYSTSSWGGTSSEILAKRFTASGLPEGDTRQLNTSTSGTQRDPSVATLADDSYVAAWSSNYLDPSRPDHGYEIVSRRFKADGSAFGAPRALVPIMSLLLK